MIVVTADWHLDQKSVVYNDNVNSKVVDFETVAKQLQLQAFEENILIIAGDLFDNNRPKPEAVTFFRYLYDAYLGNYGKVIILLGNHDSNDTAKDALHYIEAWKEKKIRVVRKLIGTKIDNLKVVLLPHLSKFILFLKVNQSYEEALSKKLQEYKKVLEQADLVIGHGSITGATMGTEQFSFRKGMTLPPIKGIAVLGHIHKPQKVGKDCYYVGSPIYTDFAEIDDKKQFIGIVNLSHSIPTVTTFPLRQLQKYIEIHLDYTKSAKVVLSKIKVGNFIYKIVIKTTKAIRPKINTVLILEKFNTKGFVQSLKFETVKSVKQEEEALGGIASIQNLTPLVIFKGWVQKNITDKRLKKIVYDKGREALETIASSSSFEI